MNSEVFLLLGTNLGDTSKNLESARHKLASNSAILKASSVYRTAAWGNTDQPDFYNQVLEIKTNLEPEALLQEVLKIELEIGRERKERWGPRVIDVDILFYQARIVNQANLIIPHPGIPDRLFALMPLVEISPDFIHPVVNKSLATLLSECPDKLGVERL